MVLQEVERGKDKGIRKEGVVLLMDNELGMKDFVNLIIFLRENKIVFF